MVGRTTVETRFYGTPFENRLSGGSYKLSPNAAYDHIHKVTFTVSGSGTATIGLGSPYIGSFEVKWIALIEGAFTEGSFPRPDQWVFHAISALPSGPVPVRVPVPLTATEHCLPNSYAVDESFMYWCTEKSAWHRIALSTW